MTRFDPLHPLPCVYFKHGAYWYVKRGKWQRISATLEDALAWYARNVHAPADGRLSGLLETALAHHLKTVKLSASTKRQYRRTADVLKRRLRLFDPGTLRPKHVAQLKADMAATPNMANRYLSLLRTLCAYLVEWGEMDANPVVGVRRLAERKRDRLLTPAEWQAIHDAAGPRLRVIMRLQLLTGQRINDVLRIRRNQLVEEGIAFAQQKTGSRLIVEWSDDLRSAVADALALAGKVPSLYLLPGRRGKAPDYRSVARQFTDAAKAAGVDDAKPNDQRAQALTEAKRQGMNATALAGHSSPAMTERYLRARETPVVSGPKMKKC